MTPSGIGVKLKAARVAQRRTLDDVALECGVTKGYLSKLERDRINASVATLIKVCGALDIAVGSLFDEAAVGEVVRSGSYPSIAFGGDGMDEYLLTPRGERRMQVLRSDIGAGGGSGSEPYELPVDVEFAYVISGKLHITFRGDPAHGVVLEEGDAFTFSPRVPHSFVAVDGGARVLWVLAPALPEGSR
ncbi:helix-turn-helix domain-containing protein [Actinomycetes bacterium M1A6_2h]